jgi:hypothetical protein
VAQRFSLKDNPIFQKFVPQTSPDTASPVEETQEGQTIVPEGQNLTVNRQPSESDARNVLAEQASASSPSVDIFTSSNQQVVPLREEPLEREEMDFDGQNLTVKERPPEDDAQKLPPARMSDSSSPQVF